MPNHVRKQIRAAAVTAITGLASTGSSVFEVRALALAEDVLPAWVVMSGSESVVDEERTTGHEIRRDLELTFEGYARAATGDAAQNVLDEMLKELEVAIYTSRKFGGLTRDTVLQTVETDIDDSGDRVFGFVNVTYVATYWTARGVPDVAL